MACLQICPYVNGLVLDQEFVLKRACKPATQLSLGVRLIKTIKAKKKPLEHSMEPGVAQLSGVKQEDQRQLALGQKKRCRHLFGNHSKSIET